jgi:hypothetical protein
MRTLKHRKPLYSVVGETVGSEVNKACHEDVSYEWRQQNTNAIMQSTSPPIYFKQYGYAS